jgi:hypothetical protein
MYFKCRTVLDCPLGVLQNLTDVDFCVLPSLVYHRVPDSAKLCEVAEVVAVFRLRGSNLDDVGVCMLHEKCVGEGSSVLRW